MNYSLELKLEETLRNGEAEETYINETFTGIIYVMKKIVEDDSYRNLFYNIGKQEEKYDTTTLEGSLKQQKALDIKRFGPENMLTQILWDAQIPEYKFDEVFKTIVDMAKKVCEDEKYKKQLYSIDLNNYKDEEWE
jgi:hypothetical protein